MSSQNTNPVRLPLDGFIHKINNPLGALMLWAQELAKPIEDKRRQEIAECLLREVRSLRSLLKRVAAIDGAMKPRWAKVRMDAVVRQAVASVTVDLPGAAYPEIELPKMPVFIEGDAPLLAQLVEQVLRNAVESGSDRVWVRLEAQSDVAVVEVIDEGCGLEAGLEKNVWQPFYSTKPGHAGIGLNLAARAAQVHGGSFDFTPRHPVGSRARVELPLKKDSEREAGER